MLLRSKVTFTKKWWVGYFPGWKLAKFFKKKNEKMGGRKAAAKPKAQAVATSTHQNKIQKDLKKLRKHDQIGVLYIRLVTPVWVFHFLSTQNIRTKTESRKIPRSSENATRSVSCIFDWWRQCGCFLS